MNPIKRQQQPSCYSSLQFRQVSERLPLRVGFYTAKQLAAMLASKKGVSNFAPDILPGSDPQRIFEITQASAYAAIVEITVGGKCPIDETFSDRALSAGFGMLSDAAGPLLALQFEKFGDVGNVIVMTEKLGGHRSVKDNGRCRWRIMRRISAATLLFVETEPSIERRAFMAFSVDAR